MKRTKEDDTKPVDEVLEIVWTEQCMLSTQYKPKINHQKKKNISKSAAPWVMKLKGGLNHIYTKAWMFWTPAVLFDNFETPVTMLNIWSVLW